MFFKQFYNKKLSQYSYMIACQESKEALIVDPLRVLDDYEQTIAEEGLQVVAVAETHIHADYASGIRQAARHFNSTAYVSGETDEDCAYRDMPEDTVYLKEKDYFKIGNSLIQVVHTSGHTPEHISFVLTDQGAGSVVPMGMFSGDFIFVSDIGRPDLLEETGLAKDTTEEAAEQMFESIQKMSNHKCFLQIWPGHGAGSPCGKSLNAFPLSTLGYERRNNWAFKLRENKEAFMSEITDNQPEAPKYFSKMKEINREGLPDFEVREIEVGTPDDLPGQVFDLRKREDFKKSFMTGAINLPYNKKFLQFAGWLIDYDQAMTLIADPSQSEAIQKDLALIGYDKVELIVPADQADKYANDSYESVSAEEFLQGYEDKQVLDVRNLSEWQEGHLDNAVHIHFGKLAEADLPFNKEDAIYVHCASGVRSAIAVSIMKGLGYDNVVNIDGGYGAIKKVMQ